jgi:hypothetical protein
MSSRRAKCSTSPQASSECPAIRPVIQCNASITVLPVTWTVPAATFSRRSASAAVAVGAK